MQLSVDGRNGGTSDKSADSSTKQFDTRRNASRLYQATLEECRQYHYEAKQADGSQTCSEFNVQERKRCGKGILASVDEMKRCNRRTSTPAELKEIALLAIHAAREDGWTEYENNENDLSGTYRDFRVISMRREAMVDEVPHPMINPECANGGSPLLLRDGSPAPRNELKSGIYNPGTRVDDFFTGIHFDFSILGTSADDQAASPHVLSPSLMHRLQEALPFCKRGESFWLKYSLVRNGASLSTFLNKMRGSKYSILALETVDGEVFGAFTGEQWHFDHTCYGTGDSFVWKMKHHRGNISDSIAEQARKESEVEIFRYAFETKMIQLCQSHPCRLAVGVGCCHFSREVGCEERIASHQWGFAISFDDGCSLEGTSSPCITF